MQNNVLDSSLSSVERLRAEFRTTLQGIREEFDEHLETINENTTEIQSNFEYICRLESKIEKLSERFEQIQMLLARHTGMSVREPELDSISLTPEEKEVFLVIYTASPTKLVTYADIASAIRISEFLVRSYVTNLMEKGVPIVKHYVRGEAYLSIDESFRELQAKRNILRISQRTVDNYG